MNWQKYIVKTPITKSDKAVKNKPKEYIKTKIKLDKKRGFMAYLFRRIFPFFVLGIIYLIWLRMTHLYIPCIFHSLTGLKCPGCGISNMCVHISKFNFLQGFKDNPFIFITGPLIILEIIYFEFLRYHKKTLPLWNNICIILYCVALIIFGVLRNIL